MTSLRLVSFPLFLLPIALAFTVDGAPRKKAAKKKGPPPINKDAERLARAIPKYHSKGDRKAAETEMRQLIHMLAETNRDSVSSNSALLKKAMDFRADIGPHQKTTTIGAILKAWETAFDCGAIRGHHFTGRSTRGRYHGELLVFENIVPPEILPECRGYLGNLRLVPESLARKEGAALDHKDEAYAIGLRQVMREDKTRTAMLEIEKSKVGHLALTEAQHEQRWWKEVADTGDSYQQPPNLQLLGQRMSTPSKMNGYVYRLRVEVTNMSRHPTEVEIESTIVGYTENDNELYEMRRDRRVLRLRRSQVHEYLIKTPNINAFKKPLKGYDPKKSQKVIYRGFTIVARFKDEVIGSTGSDGRMMRVASGEYAAPPMITGASRSGGPKPAGGRAYDLMQFPTPGDLAAGKNGTTICSGLANTIGLMADETRMYRLDSGGTLWIYESASFRAAVEPLGDVFAGPGVHSLFSDGSYYYLHLSRPAGSYGENDVVRFSSVTDLISGESGTVMGQAAPGSAAFMGDGKSFYKLHHGNVQEALLSHPNLEQLLSNTGITSEGKLFCGKNHRGVFSDGTHYYLLVDPDAG